MAQRIGPAGTVRLALGLTIGANNTANIFWTTITPSGTVTQADLDTYVAAVGAAYKLRFNTDISSTFAYGTVKGVYFVDGTPLNVLESQASMTGNGGGASTGEPATCAVISWLAGIYWRGGKPRTYLPTGATVADGTAPGRVTGAGKTNITTHAGQFMTDLNALTAGATISGSKLGFVSFQSGGADRVPPLFFAYTGLKVHSRLGHQRRRDGKWLN